jgi:hypothetical protein
MKMIKRTLIAIAVVAILATTVNAAITEWYFPIGDQSAVKVDGKETPTFRWPYEVSYKALTICSIPIKLQVGMFVQIEDCKNKKIVLTQVGCTEQVMGKGDGDFPCYYGCVTFRARANFNAKFGQALVQVGDIVREWSCAYDGGDTIPNDGEYHELKVCVKAWKVQLWHAPVGDEVDFGKINITVKPQ